MRLLFWRRHCRYKHIVVLFLVLSEAAQVNEVHCEFLSRDRLAPNSWDLGPGLFVKLQLMQGSLLMQKEISY